MPSPLLRRIINTVRPPQIRYPANPQECLQALHAVNPQAAAAIQSMPFLNPIPHPGAFEATLSLLQLTLTQTDTLRQAIQNPITPGDIPRIAALYNAQLADHQDETGLVQKLLTPGQTVTQEARDRHGDRFAIVRPADAKPQPDTMTHLINAAQICRSLFNRPLPATAVIALIAEPQNHGPHAGNAISSIILHPNIETPGNVLHQNARSTLAHETAHFYWRHNRPWINEGLAELAAIIAEHPKPPIHPNRYPSAQLNSPAQLEIQNTPVEVEEQYSIGQRFFIQLLNQTGLPAFRNAIGNLHDRSRKSTLSVRHIRKAFPKHRDLITNLYLNGPTPTFPVIQPADPNPPLAILRTDLLLSPPAADTVELPTPALAVRGICRRQDQLVISQFGPDGLRYSRNSLPISPQPQPQEETIIIPAGPPQGKPWKPGDHLILIANHRGQTIHAHRFTIRETKPKFATPAGHGL